MIWLIIINILILLTSIRYYLNAKATLKRLDPTNEIFVVHSHKYPIVVVDEFVFNTQEFVTVGSVYYNRMLSDSRHRMIDQVAHKGYIEVTEEPIDYLTKKVKQKLTILK